MFLVFNQLPCRPKHPSNPRYFTATMRAVLSSATSQPQAPKFLSVTTIPHNSQTFNRTKNRCPTHPP
nr:MAG TPA: hypothetical protein [Caudoviricetes sp.]